MAQMNLSMRCITRQNSNTRAVSSAVKVMTFLSKLSNVNVHVYIHHCLELLADTHFIFYQLKKRLRSTCIYASIGSMMVSFIIHVHYSVSPRRHSYIVV